MKTCSGQIRYLIAIRELLEKDEYIRCVNISNHLGVSRPSVSKMLRCLAESGFVYEDFCNSVVLTPEGRETAEELYRNFKDIYIFFHNFLRLPESDAHAQAVKFIASFPDETCKRLRKIVNRTLANKK